MNSAENILEINYLKDLTREEEDEKDGREENEKLS